MLNLLGTGVQKLQGIQKKVEDSIEQAFQGDKAESRTSADQDVPFGNSSRDPAISSNDTPGVMQSNESAISNDGTSRPEPNKIDSATRRELSELRAENEQLLSEGSRLSKRVAAMEEKSRERLKELELTIKAKKDLEVKLQKSDENLSRSQESIKRLEALLQQEQGRCLQLQKELETSVRDNQSDALQSELEGLQEEKEALVQAVRVCESENERLRLSHTEVVSVMESDITQLRKYIRELEERPAEISSTCAPIVWAGTPVDFSPDIVIENEALRRNIQDLSIDLQNSEEKLLASMELVSELESETKSLKASILEHQSTVSKLESRLLGSESVRKALSESLHDEVTRREAANAEEISILQKKCDTLSHELVQLKEERVKMHGGLKFAEPSGSNDEDLKRKFEIALQAIGKLTDDLEEARQREEMLKRALPSR